MNTGEDAQPRSSRSALNPLVLSCFERWESALDDLDAPAAPAALTVLCDVGPQQLGHPRLVQLAMLWRWSKRQPLQFGALQDATLTLWSPNAHGLSALSMTRSARQATAAELTRWLELIAANASASQVLLLSANALGEGPWRYHIQQPARLSEPLSVALWQGDSIVDRVRLEPPEPDEARGAFGALYLPQARAQSAPVGEPLRAARFGSAGARIIALAQDNTIKVAATPSPYGQRLEPLSFTPDVASLRPVALGWLGRAPLSLMLDLERQELSLWRGDVRWLTLGEPLPSFELLKRALLPNEPAASLPTLVVGRGYRADQGKRWAMRAPDGQLVSGACAPAAPINIEPSSICSITKLLGQLWQLRELDLATIAPKAALDATLLARAKELVLEHTGASSAQLLTLAPSRHQEPADQEAPHLPLPVLRMSAPRVAALLLDRDGQPKLAAQINDRWCWSGALVVTHWQDRFLFELPPNLQVVGVMPSAHCAEELGFIALDEPTRTHLWFAGRRFERLLWRAPERISAACLDTTGRRVLLTGTSGRHWLVSSHHGELLWTGRDLHE